MEVLKQSNLICTVSREENEMCSKTILVSREWEIEAQLLVDIHTFDIKNATWEVHKGPQGIDLGLRKIDDLNGMNGYIQGKKELNFLIDRPCGNMMKYMFSQCINGLIQGETYVYKERGYETEEEYNCYWDELEKCGCRMYKYIDSEDLRWMTYAASHGREKNIFNRFKSCNIISYGAEDNIAKGVFSDSYHELNIEILFNKNTGTVLDCNIFFLRAPGKACFTNDIHKKNLLGKSLYEISKIDVINLLGRGEGCYHLVDITLDILELVNN